MASPVERGPEPGPGAGEGDQGPLPQPPDHVAAGGTDSGLAGDPFAARLPLVARLAQQRRGLGLEIDELFQEGAEALARAIREFGASGSSDLDSYVEGEVGRQMDAALAGESMAGEHARLLTDAAEAYQRAEIELAGELERQPTSSEMAMRLEWTPERLEVVAEMVAKARRDHDLELLQYLDPEEEAASQNGSG